MHKDTPAWPLCFCWWLISLCDTADPLGKDIECSYWGNLNPAAQAVVALYESMPQFRMFKINADNI